MHAERKRHYTTSKSSSESKVKTIKEKLIEMNLENRFTFIMINFFISHIKWICFTNFKHWSRRKILIEIKKKLFSIDFVHLTCFNFAIKSSKSASVLHAKACKDKTIKSNSIINYFLTKASEGSRPENFILFTRSQ
jgi:hypothetical protein